MILILRSTHIYIIYTIYDNSQHNKIPVLYLYFITIFFKIVETLNTKNQKYQMHHVNQHGSHPIEDGLLAAYQVKVY